MVIFINYEDFYEAIDEQIEQTSTERPYFFSGYDCDSLALEGITDFTRDFLTFFAERPHATLQSCAPRACAPIHSAPRSLGQLRGRL